MTTLPRDFCPDCDKPLVPGQRIHGLYHEHMECHDARVRGELPSDEFGQPPKAAIFDPEWKPVPDQLSGINATGWLAPDGKFYGCSTYVHIALGDALAQYFGIGDREGWTRASQDLETARWAHVSSHGVHWRVDDRGRDPTQAQRDVLWDWFMEIKDKLSEHNLDQRALRLNLELLFRVGED